MEDDERRTDPPSDPWRAQREALGDFIRTQRRLANLSLRELADLTKVSNPYLSQVERGLHAPSVRVLQSIARALNLSADMVLSQAGLFTGEAEATPDEEEDAGAPRPSSRPSSRPPSTEAAIRADPKLTEQQKSSLLAVYRSYVGPDAPP